MVKGSDVPKPGRNNLHGMSRPVLVIIAICLAALSGCQSYRFKPLPGATSFPVSLAHLVIDPATMPLSDLKTHRFDPRDGLDMTEVAMLAVANNPDLKIARDEVGIATAQAVAAGLLPDPQLTAGVDFPTGNTPGNNFVGNNYGVSYDIAPLLLRPSVKAAAEAEKRKTDLNLLWQEWQVVAQARLLFVKTLERKRLAPLLKENLDLLARRYQHSRMAFDSGYTTIDALTADFTALQELSRQLNDLNRHQSENRFALNELLGLAPETELELVGGPLLPDLDAERIRADLPRLALRRPDLMALRAGYESQDQRLRQAILAQFPALNVGIHRARDNSDVRSVGPAITIALPIFNRNRGNIAIEEATRQRLYDEFQSRLNTAVGDVERILTDVALLERLLADARKGLTAARRLAEASEAAYRQRNISETAYVTARGELLGKWQEEIQLEQDILEQRVALQALIGGELPCAGDSRREKP